MEEPGATPQPYLGLVLEELRRDVAALPESRRPYSSPYGFPWELVVCAAVVGFFAVLLFLWRGFRSVRSRLYMRREKQLAATLSGLIEEKCKLLEKFSLIQKDLEATCEKLNRSNSELEDESFCLEKDFKEEKSKHSQQDELMADISKRIQALEDESKSLKSQIAEAKIICKIFNMSEERREIAIKDALNENSQLLESQKQLLQEAEVWKEQVSELNEQKITFEDSKAHAEQVLNDKENHIKTLTGRLLKMKDQAAVLGEDIRDDDNLELEVNGESENGTYLDDPPTRALKKLIHAAELNVSLKTLEGERNHIIFELSEVDKTKEELTERIKNLQTQQASLQSETMYFERENQKLQQKLKIMTEFYQENEVKLHRELTVEENSRIQQEEKLSKVEKKISHTTEGLEAYGKLGKDLEEELKRTINFYQRQVISYEKKGHDNWLAARTAERNLNDLRKENAHNRKRLTETELKFELLEKDPCAPDVSNTAFGREHSPCGPSPLSQPPSETRAFLSPQTVLEGPLRPSPVLPGRGGRGPRGPGNPLDHQITNERGEPGCDTLTDPHRAPSDTRSLSSSWEQDRRMTFPLPGQSYPDSAPPPQREDGYSNSDGLSGPAELRSFNVPSLDQMDGSMPSEMESSRNDAKDHPGNLNVPDSSLPAKNEATGTGFVPAPLAPIRGPLFPVNTRGPFMRRGPPFPPPPPGTMFGVSRGYYYPPRDFPGPPHAPFAMRNICPPRAFPPYLHPRPGFYPNPTF
ncbi:cTAGE family member 8-like isoform X2 [Rhinopithecus roxellana]|uniref:cTAGE family member 8-like isoform X1 n=1 Tax=Rhinopithecus roxellana TaxID=61622 RepID=UPI0012377FD5|nr:cTAGE family member 8-like isoform X1 [Rhinopithecus roxellana]XP_030788809.1 cTAGE family member 8-like isoform X2 [Rhinopithecus roxellana]XP_030788856.1 cTAGE family member 8-like isoform X2 [Rhinopithecus roxellana]